MVDAETKTYFRKIEDQFAGLRRSPITLSSNDFHRICRWKDQGIPLAIVLRGMSRYFERIKENPKKKRWFISVSFCEKDILDLWEDDLVKQIGARREKPPSQHEDREPGDILSGAISFLEDLVKETHEAGFSKLSGDFKREARKLKKLSEKTVEEGESDAVDRALSLTNGRIAKKLALLLDEEKLVEFKNQSESELSEYRERMEARVFTALQEKLLYQKIRAHFGFPDLGME